MRLFAEAVLARHHTQHNPQNRFERLKSGVGRRTIIRIAVEEWLGSNHVKLTRSRLIISAALSALACLAAGGCPLAAESLDPTPAGDDLVADAGIVPGTYWVEDFESDLLYFELGRERGDQGRWVTIEDADISWYAGPGMHEFDPSTGWRSTDSDAATSLDQLIQLHDPAPRVPDNSP